MVFKVPKVCAKLNNLRLQTAIKKQPLRLLRNPKMEQNSLTTTLRVEQSNTKCDKNHTSQPVEWYVMRVTYQRELVARRLLDDMGIRSFVPTEKVRRKKSGGGYYFREVAKLHNYIFIHTTLDELQQIKTNSIPYLRYMMGKDEEGNPAKQFVPEKQMEDFMAICASEGATMVDEMMGLREGDRVRILTGPLQGVEGIYTSTSPRGRKRVVVRIEGVAAVATASFPLTDVEKV